MIPYLNLVLESLNNGLSVMTTVYAKFGISLFALFIVGVSWTMFMRYIFRGFIS